MFFKFKVGDKIKERDNKFNPKTVIAILENKYLLLDAIEGEIDLYRVYVDHYYVLDNPLKTFVDNKLKSMGYLT